MIIFKRIRYKNFLSTGNIFTEIELNATRSTLIYGTNGAGKSSVFDAISYVLYNKTIKKLNAAQVINTITQKNLLVEIEFETNKNHYMISRGMKPSIFEIYKDGILVNQDSEKRDYQEYLEKFILKMNFKTFKQIVLLSSTNFTPFMQLTPSQRREVIEDLLDIQVFSQMNAILKEKILVNKAALKDAEVNILMIQSKIELTKKHNLEIQNNNLEIIEQKQAQLENLKLSFQKQMNQVKHYNDKIIELTKKEIECDKAHKALQKLNSNKNACLDKIHKLEKDIKFYQSNDDCPICKQNITLDFKNTQVDNKAAAVKNIIELEKDIVHKYEVKTTEYEELSEFVKELQEIKEKLIILQGNMTHSQKSMNSLKNEISDLTQKNLSPTKIEEAIDFSSQLSGHQEDRQRILYERELFNISSLLLKDGGVKSLIIKQYMPTMNQLVQKYLLAMEFDTVFGLDENFSEKITTRFKDTFTYDSFSQGQKSRIDIALMLTWRDISKMRNSVTTNLLLLDETFDNSLDEQGNEDSLRILKNMVDNVNLFVISHKFNMADKFERVLEFKEDKGFSRLLN